MALFLLLPLLLFAGEKKTICLSMIVKDEKPVILKCLASVKPYIDHWIIVDTGSKDGTQEAIAEFMKDIPGQLYERPWVDFAHNRNKALELSRKKGDYSLIIDADNILTPSPSFKIPPLTGNLYAIPVFLKKEDGSVGSSLREFLVRNQFPCRWEGVIMSSPIRSPDGFCYARKYRHSYRYGLWTSLARSKKVSQRCRAFKKSANQRSEPLQIPIFIGSQLRIG